MGNPTQAPPVANVVPIEDIYPLAPLQCGMLLHGLLRPAEDPYFRQISCRLHGEVDGSALAAAWQLALDRHPALRTAFVWDRRKEPVQAVHRRLRLPWEELDWRVLPAPEAEARARAFLAADRDRPFALNRAPLLRLALLRLSAGESLFVWSYHHLLLDGWSMPLLLREVFELYAAALEGRSLQLPSPGRFGEFVRWLGDRDTCGDEAYWRAELAGFAAPTPLAPTRAVPASGDAEALPPRAREERRILLDGKSSAVLAAWARRQGLTLFTVVQGAWAWLLGLWSGESDVVFGVTVAGRPAELPNVESCVGVFINTVPSRVGLDPRARVLDWLVALQAKSRSAEPHHHALLSDVQGWSEVGRGTQLFDSLVVFENLPHAQDLTSLVPGLEVTDLHHVEGTNYPLTLVVAPQQQLVLVGLYDPSWFEPADIDHRLQQLAQLLARLPEGGALELGALSSLSSTERAQLLAGARPVQLALPVPTLTACFEEVARRLPTQTAVRCGEAEMTYGELDAASNRLARRLLEVGAGSEGRVGLLLDRSLDLVVAALAILKSGAAYVPIDPVYPAERVQFVLSDARVLALVSTEALAARLEMGGVPKVLLDLDAPLLARLPGTPLNFSLDADALAYVIYTSGSTGRPKGALVTHANVLRLLASANRKFGFGPTDVWTLFHSIAFDFSVWELWGALLYGGTLIVVPYLVSRSPRDTLRLLAAEGVTVLNQTPSAFHPLAEVAIAERPELALRWVIFGGEALEPSSLAAWFAAFGDIQPQLVNMYGITETTVHVTYRELGVDDLGARSVIGEPLDHLGLILLNARRDLVPVGAPGELYVGGDGLARGYLGRAGLTAERFVPDPFALSGPGGRLYRTGDLARRLLDGDLEYLGRIDQQVKIRGFRIELGEIEAALQAEPSVARAVVVARGTGASTRLVAYLVAGSGLMPSAAQLRQGLERRLPPYMVPAAFVVLERLPLTHHGKVDFRALPDPGDGTGSVGDSAAEAKGPQPTSVLEGLVAGVWAAVLEREVPGVEEDFFQLGGHSLLATQVMGRLGRLFGRELPLSILFEAPTVAQSALRIEELLREEDARVSVPLVAIARDQPLPASFTQRRLWVLDQWTPGSPAFNVPIALELEGQLDVGRLVEALGALVARHEALRTTFAEDDSGLWQRIAPAAPARPSVIDLGALHSDDVESVQGALLATEARRSFALSATLGQPEPLVRSGLLRLGPSRHAFWLTLHHLIADGWSLAVLTREFSALYTRAEANHEEVLPALPIQYADFAAWQIARLDEARIERELAFWRDQLLGCPSRFELPFDRVPGGVRTERGANHRFELPEGLGRAVEALSAAASATPFMTLLAGYFVLLSRVTGQTDGAVGCPIAGRDPIETEGLIGCFLNTLVLRADLEGNPTFRELIERVRSRVLAAYLHRDLPFDVLVERLAPSRDAGTSVLFNTLFVFQNLPARRFDVPGLAIRRIASERRVALLDLALELELEDGRCHGFFNYNVDLFEAETIADLAERFVRLLDALLADPDRRLGSFDPAPAGPSEAWRAVMTRDLEDC
jgi:amino acid adenylation domain-containing protein